jgi:predicted transcriptional regulator
MAEDKVHALEAEQMRTVGQIVSSFLERTTVSAGELPALIRSVRDALASEKATSAEAAVPEAAAAPATQEPAVPVRRSVRPDHLVCLECGAKQKTLKRHLSTAHRLSVDEYRAKWNLPRDYPMVAPDYAARRSALAKQIGLGRRGAGEAEAPAAAEETPAPEAAAAPRRRGRKTAA